MADEPTDKDQESEEDPPKSDTFDRAYVERLRKENAAARQKIKDLEPRAAKADQLEEASKTEVQKLTDKLTAAESAVAQQELNVARLEVALEKGLTATQAKRLLGATKDELVADADELLESFKPDTDSEDQDPPPDQNAKPKPKLKPGRSDDMALNGDPLLTSLKSKLGI